MELTVSHHLTLHPGKIPGTMLYWGVCAQYYYGVEAERRHVHCALAGTIDGATGDLAGILRTRLHGRLFGCFPSYLQFSMGPASFLCLSVSMGLQIDFLFLKHHLWDRFVPETNICKLCVTSVRLTSRCVVWQWSAKSDSFGTKRTLGNYGNELMWDKHQLRVPFRDHGQ